MTANELIKKANNGIVGIDEELNVFGGYDSRFESAGAKESERPEWYTPEEWDPMPKEEKRILADRMIALWQRYKDEIN